MHDSGTPQQFHVKRPGRRHALALAMLASLCSAGAQAQLFGPGTATTATQLKWVSNEPGHQLVTPYYSTQGDNNTLLSYVNTDLVNGKLLKVRFRGAANGDALLDFMVLLAPGDVWTASLSQGPDGIARISSPDKSCTLPSLPAQGVSFDTAQLQADLSATAKALHTREGLVEAINMADVPPGSALFTAMLAVRNAAPCTAAALAPLTQVGAIDSEAKAQAAGLAPPSGGLTGAWQTFACPTTPATAVGKMPSSRWTRKASAPWPTGRLRRRWHGLQAIQARRTPPTPCWWPKACSGRTCLT